MPSAAKTVGEAYNEGAISAGNIRWQTLGGGSAGASATRKWLDRNYPNLSTSQKGNLYDAIRNSVEIGNRYKGGSDTYQPLDSSYTDTRSSQRRAGRTGSTQYYYTVVYEYRYRDIGGKLTTGYYRDVLSSDKPLSKAGIGYQAKDAFSPIAGQLFSKPYKVPKYGDRPVFKDVTVESAWMGL